MVRVLRPFSFLLGFACMVLAFGWVVMPQLVNYPAPFLQWMGPVSVVRQSSGPVRMFEGNSWKLMTDGQSLRGARAFSVGAGGNAIFEIPGHGFVKVEENSLVTVEDSNLGFQIRIVKGSADVRASVAGALSLERRAGQRPPIVHAAPELVAPQAAPVPVQVAKPIIPERSVAKERPVKLKQIIKQAKRPTRQAASVKPPVRRAKAPAAPAAPAMIPQILPIQVE